MKDVDSDSIYVISALATALKGEFALILDDFYNFLAHALVKINDTELFKTSLGALADVARACEAHFAPKLEVMKSLISCLTSPAIDRDLKLHVFVTIGDVFLGTYSLFIFKPAKRSARNTWILCARS